MKPMNEDLPQLLDRWREGSLSAEEMRSLTELLAKPDARATLRRDWFLEAALPQSLAASSVIVRSPQPSLAARMRAGLTRWLTLFAPGDARSDESSIFALRLWARASFAALAVGLIAVSWFAWPQREETALNSEPAYIAQLMLQNQLPDSP